MARRPDPRSSRRPLAANPVNKFASSPQTASRRAAFFARRAAADALLLSAPADASWAERFVERYEIHRELNAAERAGRRGRTGRGDRLIPQEDPAAAEERRQFVERARDTTARVDARFRIGFRWFGGYVSGNPGRGGRGYWRSAFRYDGLVSTEHPILRLFVTKLHRARRLLTGNDKGAVTAGGPKVLALDDAYVHANADMRGVIRVELDRDFASWDQLRQAVLACGVPMPNIAVAHVHEVTGAVQAPHLIWLLEHSVCFTGRGRAAPQLAFRSALQRLTVALAAAGADQGGRSNALKMKNPLSPRWSRTVWAEEPYQSLAAVCAGLPEARDVTVAEVAGKDNAAEVEGSNSLFRRLRAFAFDNVGRHHPDGEGAGSRGEFEQEVVTHGYEIADACCASERQARATAMKVATYAWGHFDGGRWKMKQNWGVCAAQTKGLTEAEAKAVGGRYAAARRREASVEKLVAAYRRLAAVGREPSRAAVAGEAGLCVRTAERRWDEVMRAVPLANAEPAVEGMTIAPLDKKVIPADGQENAAGERPGAADDAEQMAIAPIQLVIGTCEPDLPLPAGDGRGAGAKHVDGKGRLQQGRHQDAWFTEDGNGTGTRARLGHVGDGSASEPVTASPEGRGGGRPGIVVRSVRRRTMTSRVSPTVVVRTTGRP
ncbi:replication initiation protein [Azospirillum sp. HJ39]|uniref:replication initiation protein n=1 Tax=Azospirillum sp. HJ39 TaxID=3159496 RepID=UPI003555D7B2